ncbi:hypothetical protein IN820_04215, partial [Pseudomonas sp. AL-54]|nr:hypothetical protein [Pseudomonas lopnurensis]
MVRETYQSEVVAGAPSSITAGGDFRFAGTSFSNLLSTVSAAGDIEIQTERFSNQGAVSGTIERTRTYRHGGVTDGTVHRFVDAYVLPYNRRNNPDFPLVYYVNSKGEIRLARPIYEEFDGYGYVSYRDVQSGAVVGTLSGLVYSKGGFQKSQYDPDNLLALPDAFDSRTTLLSDVEVSTSEGATQHAVIQAGGDVVIQASERLDNGVVFHDYVHGQGNQLSVDTAPLQSGTTFVRLNAQLPPDLAQQQVNPLTLPGFSLPTGQNGLFRLSDQGGSEGQVRDAIAEQDWALSGATLDQVQREAVGGVRSDDVRVGQLGELQVAGAQLQAGEREQASGLPGTATGVQLGNQPGTREVDGLGASGLSVDAAGRVTVGTSELADTQVQVGEREQAGTLPGQSGVVQLDGQPAASAAQTPQAVGAFGEAPAGVAVEAVSTAQTQVGASELRGVDVRLDAPSAAGQTSVPQVGPIDTGSQVAPPTVSATPQQAGERASSEVPSATQVALDGQEGGAGDIPRAQGVPVTQVTQPHKYLIETNPALTDLKQFM